MSNPWSKKLSEEQVKVILKMAKDAKLPYSKIGEQFGVSPTAISMVARNAGIERRPAYDIASYDDYLVKLWHSDRRVADIARELNKSTKTIATKWRLLAIQGRLPQGRRFVNTLKVESPIDNEYSCKITKDKLLERLRRFHPEKMVGANQEKDQCATTA